jgi:hypothetical protein
MIVRTLDSTISLFTVTNANSGRLESICGLDCLKTRILSYRTKGVRELCELYTHRVALHGPVWAACDCAHCAHWGPDVNTRVSYVVTMRVVCAGALRGARRRDAG